MTSVYGRNGRIPFQIHDEELEIAESEPEDDDIIEEQEEESHEQEMYTAEEYYDSEESDGVVDPVVQEDMNKFEDTFVGIRERYRLINRIGEGKFVPITSSS
jgi:cell division control protein 7